MPDTDVTLPGHAFPTEGESGGDDTLIGYWRILARRKKAWTAFILSGAVAGFLIAFPRTPLYRATTSVEIVGLNEDFLNLKSTSPITIGSAPADNVSEIQTHIKLLESHSLAQRVVSRLSEGPRPRLKVDERFTFFRSLLHLRQLTPAEEYKRFLDDAAKSVKAKPSGQTRLIEITVDSADPHLAAEFVNTLANEFIQQNLESHWKTAKTTSEWLSKQLDDMRLKLERSQHALQAYAVESGLIFTGERDSVSEAKLRQLQQELSAAQGERIANSLATRWHTRIRSIHCPMCSTIRVCGTFVPKFSNSGARSHN